MEETSRRIETGPTPSIVVTETDGPLRVEGWERPAVAAEGMGLELEELGGEVHLTGGRDCRLQVPAEAHLRLELCGGSLRVTGLSGPVSIAAAAGDVAVRDTGPVEAEAVGGALKARHVAGHLRVGRIGGGLTASDVDGDVAAQAVGGSVHLEAVTGQVLATCGGDAGVDLGSSLAGDCAVTAGGDVTVRIPLDPDAVIRIRSGAGRVAFPGEAEAADGAVVERTIGTGSHHIDITAGGRVTLLGPRDNGESTDDEESLGEGFAAMAEEFAVQLETGLGGLSDRLGGHLDRIASSLPEVLQGAGLGEDDVDRITDRVRRAGERAVTQAERRAEQAARRAERKIARRLAAARRKIGAAGTASGSMGHRDGDRAAILRMLEAGRIDANEAEGLLAALDRAAS